MYFKYFFIEFITNSHILCKLFLTTPQKLLLWTELVAVLSHRVERLRQREREIDTDFYFISCAAFLLLSCCALGSVVLLVSLYSSLQFSSVLLRGLMFASLSVNFNTILPTLPRLPIIT